jgi:hypothetical protein
VTFSGNKRNGNTRLHLEEFFFLSFFCGGGQGFQLRALHLQGRPSATPPVHFALVIWEMGGGLKNYLPKLVLNLNPPDLRVSSS